MIEVMFIQRLDTTREEFLVDTSDVGGNWQLVVIMTINEAPYSMEKLKTD